MLGPADGAALGDGAMTIDGGNSVSAGRVAAIGLTLRNGFDDGTGAETNERPVSRGAGAIAMGSALGV
jgi:hypothetical protein